MARHSSVKNTTESELNGRLPILDRFAVNFSRSLDWNKQVFPTRVWITGILITSQRRREWAKQPYRPAAGRSSFSDFRSRMNSIVFDDPVDLNSVGRSAPGSA